MVTREEIREGIKPLLCACCEPADRGCTEMDGHCQEANSVADNILSYLHSQGVVIKVDKVCLPLHLKELAYDDGEKVYDLKAIEYLIEGQRYPRASAKLREQSQGVDG